MNKVLFLASWYPSRVDAYNGDFIERHAKSISLYNEVFVIYAVKDPGIRDGKIVIEKEVFHNLVVYKAYYPHSGSKTGWIEKLHSNRWNFRLHQRLYKTIVQNYGQPQLVHLNVLWKAGFFAWWLKKRYHIPYVLTEHWTGFDKERDGGFLQKPALYKLLSKIIYKNCDYAAPVSMDLGQKMNDLLGKIPYQVISNVVDTSRFYPALIKKNQKTKLIHVSTLGYHKNINGILNVTERLYQLRKDFELHLVGPAMGELIQWAKDRGLKDNCIFFAGLIPYEQVAEQMRNADALVMFSRYENLPCVILEALTCGLPVLSTDVGGIKEVINEANGILIQPGREDELFMAMDHLLDNIDKFDKSKIAFSAQEYFSYASAGKRFANLYKQVLRDKHQ